MFCPNCGKETNGNEQFCNSCGCYFGISPNVPVQPVQPVYNGTKNVDEKSIGLNILSFFVPVVGLILYLVWKNDYPVKAKGCGKATLISVIASFALSFLMTFLSTFLVAIIGASATSETSNIYDVALMCSNMIP